MIVLAIDPGTRPGCVVLDDTGRVTHAAAKLDALEDWAREYGTSGAWPLVATEGQWMHRGSKSDDLDPNDLLTLAFRAGFTLASVPAVRRLRIPPRVWRGSTASKVAVQNRILRTLAPAERALFGAIPKSRHGDVLDAIGIARAAQRLAPTTTEFDWAI